MARYIVRPADTINRIADRAGISRAEFIRLNPGIDTRRELNSLAGRTVRLGPGNSISDNLYLTTNRTPNPLVEGDVGFGENLGTGGNRFSPVGQGPFVLGGRGDADTAAPTPQAPGPLPVPGALGPGVTPTPVAPPTPVPIVPAGPSAEEVEQQNQNALQMAMAAFPWINTLGMSDQLLTWIREGFEGSALVGLIRQTDIWTGMFTGIRRDDGTLRMNESTYLSTMDGYRRVLQQFGGSAGLNYSNGDLSNFLEREIDANELGNRLRIYDQVVQGGSEIRNAFYVYGGISMSDDDLYSYVVDPFTQNTFDQQYAEADDPDYGTFIARTVDVVTSDTGGTVPRDQAAETVDLLYHGGNPGGGDYLSLSELTNAFELAMLGSTATLQGLVLPDRATLQRMREAGVSRSQAIQAYGRFATDRNFINAIVSRVGGDEFTQSEFEEGTFLADPTVTNELERAQKQEQAASRGAGSFGFSNQRGRLVQAGFSSFRN